MMSWNGAYELINGEFGHKTQRSNTRDLKVGITTPKKKKARKLGLMQRINRVISRPTY